MKKETLQTDSVVETKTTEADGIVNKVRRQNWGRGIVMKPKRFYAGSKILKTLVFIAAAFTIFMLGFLIIYILVKGIPNLSPSLFSPKYTTDNVSMLPSIINTLIMIGVALAIAVPIGVFSAIYLVEYAKKGNKLVKVIRMMAETLTGIPSIVYGLFGMLFFVSFFNMSYSLLAGILTVAIMVLPTVLRTTEEALMAVPHSYREGSFGLGAGKLRTVFRIVLPSAVPRHSFRCDSGDRPYRGRDSRSDLHGRNSGGASEKPVFLRTNALGAYVCAFSGRPAHGSGIRDGGCTSCYGAGDQYYFSAGRKPDEERVSLHICVIKSTAKNVR